MKFHIDEKNRRGVLDGKEYDLLDEGARTNLIVALNAAITATPRLDMVDEETRAKLEEVKLMAVSLAENLGLVLSMIEDVEVPEDPEALEAMVGPELMDRAVEQRRSVVDKADSLGVETKGRPTADIMRDVLTRRGIRTDGLDPARVRDFYDRVPGATFDRLDRDVANSGGPGGSETRDEQKKLHARRVNAWKQKKGA